MKRLNVNEPAFPWTESFINLIFFDIGLSTLILLIVSEPATLIVYAGIFGCGSFFIGKKPIK